MKRNSIARVSLAGALVAAFCVAYLHAQFGNAPSKLNTVKITDDLYVIHNDFVPGNTTALVTNEGVLLVDDKFEIDFPNIVAEVKKLTPQPIKYVVNTHHHGDHSGSNAKMQATNVQVVASEQARENMVDGKMPGLPTMVFDHRAHIYLGGKNVELYHFGRSHTNGDVVVLFPAQRTLAAGDMFTYGDDVPELIDYAGGGSAKEWTSTLDSALQLDFDNVVPGHGPLARKADMRKFRESTLRLRNRVHELITQKKSRADIEKVMRSEFHWADLHVMVSLDGALAELQ
ncbi:MAG TPA: MBL fold metallo-hydrolase [Vicinamibacterales bacterium]|nr:MBL fold metallo-hydrolase [Vicinamibacterales bacterium]